MELKMKKKKRKISTFEIIATIILALLAIITIFPFYNVVIISFAKYEVITKSPIYILPKSFDLSSYKAIFQDNKFINAFLVSVFVTVVGAIWNMFLSVSGAYALSKKGLPGRNIILSFILFTMFFNGGLIPFYLLIKNVGLVDSIWVMIIPTGVSTFYLIIMKNYFKTIPASLEESAKIDGANDLTILLKIVLPTSAPFMATFGLFYAVERWNEWWYALMFISDKAKIPLQILLREILINFRTDLATQAQAIIQSKAQVYTQSLQMATIVVASIPILCVYPFLQKYFVRGILVGSIKE